MTFNGGQSFTLIQSYVKSFFWSSGPGFTKVFFLERWEPNHSSTVLSVNDPGNMTNAEVLFSDAKEFHIKGDYMFAMRQKDVSYKFLIMLYLHLMVCFTPGQ